MPGSRGVGRDDLALGFGKRCWAWLGSMLVPFLWAMTPCVSHGADPRSAGELKRFDLPQTFLDQTRYYWLFVPEMDEDTHELPLIIMLHGAFSTPKKAMKRTGWNALAAREHVLVAYPSGGYGVWGLMKHWNAGHCCGAAAKKEMDDVGFLDAVIEHIDGHYPLDRSRIYVVGFSNGGMLAYRFAAERSAKVAAVGVVAASTGGRPDLDEPFWHIPEPAMPVPVMIMHGIDDDSVPYEGTDSNGGKGRQYVSVEASTAFWRRHNRCEGDAQTRELGGSEATRTDWYDGGGRDMVALIKLRGWGHRWPGMRATARLREEHGLHGFQAAEVFWAFLKTHEREVK